ncbi:DUF5107 domain-containing protein [Chondrinema litorale]|uniref:DUF5107 domain-containing protein n=1 Tax=Chondrinema litorale TaxID=2994555 RepID=UPI0025437D24|nr:DUF5107 domain-containing protein [Chondrinema litorale]UZR96858.1 DUF5107 domain-containing protein [Chondrinema litorale]
MKNLVTSKFSKRTIPTYELGKPEINPVFFEKRVYQGSSGKVYPVPFIDKVYDQKVQTQYDEAILENEFVRLVMLPEIGGRIFEAQDKSNNNYDFFYKQEVIKPALVGLAGPWISGGVEFNWPQHHRPGTYLPTDTYLEEEADGAKTFWMSEYDPMYRLKGMHGIRIRPGSSLIELRARLFNRTPLTQTFLWWANVAVRVHEQYQSFFPLDVHYVADHAVRAMSSFPIAENHYYGVPYHEREGKNDLRKYENITVPTSYMVCDTKYNFFGGYDFKTDGGFIHVANRHIAPGKKQWTWGSEEFGKAWDRELTDSGGPYFELMAGVYTDNQPDFSYLLPFETKTFSQFWWSYKKLGPVQNATKDLAIRLDLQQGNKLDVGLAASKSFEALNISIQIGETQHLINKVAISPDNPWLGGGFTFQSGEEDKISMSVFDATGKLLINYKHIEIDKTRNRKVAFEPKQPENVASSIELEMIGEHLELYRHPTRYPEPYWKEAIKKDPKNYKAYISLGKSELKLGKINEAKKYLQTATEVMTTYHPNPSNGEAYYFLGLTYFYTGELDLAYSALYKATWNFEWRASAYYVLAKIDCIKFDFETALEQIEAALDTNRQNNSAIILKAVVLHKIGQKDQAQLILEDLQKIDALDQWANYELATIIHDFAAFLKSSRNDAQTIIDIAFEYAEAGCYQEAIELLKLHLANDVAECAVPNPMGQSVMPKFILSWLYAKIGNKSESQEWLEQASKSSFNYFFPSRLSEQLVLEWALQQMPDCHLAAYGLGNYFFNLKRHKDAIKVWEQAATSNCKYATLYRNLGIAYWNTQTDGEKAKASFTKAIDLAPEDMRIHFEFDQLCKKLNNDPTLRLKKIESLGDLILSRDDFSVELAALYNYAVRYEKALDLLTHRNFHPWEGGEGQVLKQYTYACLKLGQQALAKGDAKLAITYFEKSLNTPDNLGEKYHPLQAKAHINYWKGMACKAGGLAEEAVKYFTESATENGDFIDMAVSDYSEMSFYKALSLKELGKQDEALKIFKGMKNFSNKKLTETVKIDYLATSLPLLLVFEDDIQLRNEIDAKHLLALAHIGLGNKTEAKKLLDYVKALNTMHTGVKEALLFIKSEVVS